MLSSAASRVESGRSLEFAVSHVRGDSDKLKVWVQLNPDGVRVLESSIARVVPELESDSGFLHNCQLHVGHIYCARWGTPVPNKWYRVRVLPWPPSNAVTSSVAVHFIDYGFFDIVPVYNIRHCGELAHIPPQAVEFIVANVVPPSGSVEWPKDVLRFCEQNLVGKKVVGQVVGTVDTLPVVVIFRQGEREPFSDILIKHRMALSSQVIPPPHPSGEMAHYRGETFLALPLDLQKEHLVSIAHIESPQKFFIHLAENEQDLNALMEAIRIYSQKGTLIPLKSVLPGTPCLVQYSADESFYRGIVTYVSSTNCSVVFVDYGNSEIKPCTELKAIPKEFLSLPLQAYQCSLVGAKSTDGRELHLQTEGKQLSCHILDQQGSTYVVSLKHHGKVILDHLKPPSPPITENAKLPTFPLQPLKLENQRYNVIISYCFSPSEFYVQLSSNTGILNQIMADLTACEASNAILSFKDCSLRLPVSAKFSEDETWYRAEILSFDSNNQIRVKFVDYGNSEITTLDALKPLPAPLHQIPAQSVRMSLHNVQNVEKEIIESPPVVRKFEELTLDKNLVALVKGSNPQENSYIVELYDTSTKPPTDVNRLFGEFIQAKTVSSVTIPAPPLGTIEKICITAVTSQFDFFGQLTKFSTEDLEKLQARLNEVYCSVKPPEPMQVHIGQIVCAKFSGDDLFYRAKVLAARKTEAEVFFLDFGNREIVSMAKIHPLRPEFATLPQQGIQCSFFGVGTNVNSNEIEAAMMDRVLEVQLVKQVGEKWEVQLTESNPNNVEVLKVLRPKKSPGKEFGSSLGENENNSFEDWNRNTQDDALRRRNEQNWGRKPDGGRANDSYPNSKPGYPPRGSFEDERADRFSKRQPRNSRDDDRPRRKSKFASSGSSSHEESDWESSSGKPGRNKAGHQMKRFDSRGSRDSHSTESSGEYSTSRKDPEGRGKFSRPHFEEKLTNYKAQLLPEHACREITVSYVVSPSEFYCQVTESSEELDRLMDDIAKVYPALQPSDLELNNPRVGTPCCAIYSEDGGWYRAKISKCGRFGPVEVEFVDYGNKEQTTLQNVKELKPEFLKLPPQALKCCLHNVHPPGGQDWPSEAVEKFKETVGDKTFLAQFVKKTAEGSYEVNLLETDKLISGVLNKEFVEIAMAPTWTPLDIAKSVVFTEPAIRDSSREDVIVTWVKSPCEFYCQLSSMQEVFRDMMMKMQERYEALPAPEGVLDEIKPDATCVARFADDGVWYRAQILQQETNGPNMVPVFYVDYGNTDVVSREWVKHIETQFMELPLQAIKCHLRGVKPVSTDEWYKSKRSVIEHHFDEPIVCTFVCKHDGSFLVDLEKDGKSVADELVKAKLAIVDDSEPGPEESLDNFSVPDITGIPKLELQVKPGDFVDVLVSFAESPKHFWCQLQSNSEEVENLVVRLTGYYSQLSDGDQDVTNSTKGMACVAKFSEDGRWYRASVLDCPTPETLEVLFVDYGNKEIVDHTQCKTLLPEYSQLPAQAIQSVLADLPKDISEEQAQYFVDMVDGEGFKGRVEEIRGSVVVLSLFTTTEGQEINVAHTIFGSALSDAMQGTTTEIPEQEISEGEHLVKVTFVESLQRFFVQLTAWDKDVEALKKVLETGLRSPVPVAELVQGAVYCAKHPVTGAWGRVQVSGLEGDKANVEFLDSGEIATLDKDSIVEAPSDSLLLPRLAYECKLHGIADGWTWEDTEAFKILAQKEPLHMWVMGQGKLLSVLLQNKDGDIYEQLLKEGVGERTMANYEPCSLPDGDISITVCHVESVNRFYVTPTSTNRQLQDMCEQLQCAYEGKDALVVENAVVGMPCAAVYSEDGVWYRATVMSVEGNRAVIKFIDYGNTEETDLANLKVLKTEFLQLPAFAAECSLSGVREKEGLSETELCTSQFEGLVLGHEATLRVVSKKDVYDVRLVVDGRDIAEELLMSGVATRDQMDDDSKVHLLSSPIQLLSYKKCCFAPGERKTGIVTHCVDPGEFWIQFSDSQINLDDLMCDLRERYGEEKDQEGFLEVAVGMPCITSFMDGDWYRAEVLEEVDDENVRVLYVDYGNTHVVGKRTLKVIEPDLFVLPVQAARCFLHGVEPADGGGKWSADAAAIFEEEAGNGDKLLQVECVCERQGAFGVVLNYMRMDVGKKLVARGVATSASPGEGEEEGSGRQAFPPMPVEDGDSEGIKVDNEYYTDVIDEVPVEEEEECVQKQEIYEENQEVYEEEVDGEPQEETGGKAEELMDESTRSQEEMYSEKSGGSPSKETFQEGSESMSKEDQEGGSRSQEEMHSEKSDGSPQKETLHEDSLSKTEEEEECWEADDGAKPREEMCWKETEVTVAQGSPERSRESVGEAWEEEHIETEVHELLDEVKTFLESETVSAEKPLEKGEESLEKPTELVQDNAEHEEQHSETLDDSIGSQGKTYSETETTSVEESSERSEESASKQETEDLESPIETKEESREEGREPEGGKPQEKNETLLEPSASIPEEESKTSRIEDETSKSSRKDAVEEQAVLEKTISEESPASPEKCASEHDIMEKEEPEKESDLIEGMEQESVKVDAETQQTTEELRLEAVTKDDEQNVSTIECASKILRDTHLEQVASKAEEEETSTGDKLVGSITQSGDPAVPSDVTNGTRQASSEASNVPMPKDETEQDLNKANITTTDAGNEMEHQQ